jgi:hypothetical protein
MEAVMTELDPQVVRKVARTAMELAATRRDDLDAAIRRHGGLGEMPEDPEAKAKYRKAYGALYSAAAADMKAADTVVVSWPDDRDNAYGRVREFTDACGPDMEIIAGPPRHDAPYLSLSDLETVLDGHVALERIAEDAVAELNDRNAKAGE